MILLLKVETCKISSEINARVHRLNEGHTGKSVFSADALQLKTSLVRSCVVTDGPPIWRFVFPVCGRVSLVTAASSNSPKPCSMKIDGHCLRQWYPKWGSRAPWEHAANAQGYRKTFF